MMTQASTPSLGELHTMDAARAAPPFVDAEWAFELRPVRAQRMLTEFGAGQAVCLHSAHHVNVTAWFPEIVEALSGWSGMRTVLDGELCVLDEAGRNDPRRLHQRCLVRGQAGDSGRLSLVLRDVLVHEGRDVRALAWQQRHQLLRGLGLPKTCVRLPRGAIAEGVWLHRQALALGGMEVLAFRRCAAYRSGRSADCLRIPAGGDR